MSPKQVGILVGSYLLLTVIAANWEYGGYTAPAAASNIVTDLRSMKAAALEFYANSMDEIRSPAGPLSGDGNYVEFLKPYLDRPCKYTNGHYRFEVEHKWWEQENPKWWVGYYFYLEPKWWSGCDFNDSRKQDQKEVKEKLMGKARSIGLYREKSLADFYDDGDIVWMLVLPARQPVPVLIENN